MDAVVHILFSSDYYDVCNFKCQCNECTKSKREYNEHFSICFIRTGNFYYHTYQDALDTFTGSVLISKPDYEYNVTHQSNMPDECTVLTFKKTFYEQLLDLLPQHATWFFRNGDMQSLLLKVNAETEYLHELCFQAISNGACSKLEADGLVMELLQQVLMCFGDNESKQKISERFKKNHLSTIESAKQYIRENFIKDISLMDLAKHCNVSPFHFSRIFKSFTRYSPYLYLQSVRLKQAELLLKTNLPVADVAFSSGFNSIDYFSSAFKKKYRLSPTAYRNGLKTKQDF